MKALITFGASPERDTPYTRKTAELYVKLKGAASGGQDYEILILLYCDDDGLVEIEDFERVVAAMTAARTRIK